MTLLVEGLHQRRGATHVLRGVNLSVAAGSITALLGPSGCGKTSLLRLIAGFEPADAGQITLAGRIVEAPGAHIPAERRRIGYVPQDGTLFPHLDVEANIGFGLTRAERRDGRVAAAIAMTGLAGLERRYPHELSGGQQQRTALARALAPRPALVLLDEPFAALDRALRLEICAEVVAVLRASGATAVLVTHDPQEAFTSADAIAAMRDGAIVQHAAPEGLYRCPLDLGIAKLTGGTVVLPGTVADGRAVTPLGDLPVQPGAPNGPVVIMLRPEQLRLGAAGTPVIERSRQFRGSHTLLTLEIGGATFSVPTPIPPPPGTSPAVLVDGSAMAYRISRLPMTGTNAEMMALAASDNVGS